MYSVFPFQRKRIQNYCPLETYEESRIRDLLKIYSTTDRLLQLAPRCGSPWKSPKLTVKHMPPFEKFTFRYKPQNRNSVHFRSQSELFMAKPRIKSQLKCPLFLSSNCKDYFNENNPSYIPRSPGSVTTEASTGTHPSPVLSKKNKAKYELIRSCSTQGFYTMNNGEIRVRKDRIKRL